MDFIHIMSPELRDALLHIEERILGMLQDDHRENRALLVDVLNDISVLQRLIETALNRLAVNPSFERLNITQIVDHQKGGIQIKDADVTVQGNIVGGDNQ